MSSTHLTRALALSGSALALSLSMTGQSMAQSQGDVQIRPAAQSVVDSLDSLEQLLLAPPDEANMLNIYVTPQFRRERYEAYSEEGDIFAPDGNLTGFPVTVDSRDFEADTVSISVGADYLLDGKWLLGGQINYSETDFDYDTPSEDEFLQLDDFRLVNNDLAFGDAVDREFDEYGFSVSAGYLEGPWTMLFTTGYSHRNIETKVLKVGAYFINPTTGLPVGAAELHGVEADFNSNIYSADLGGSYRYQTNGMTLQPYASIGYQLERIDDYKEDFSTLRFRSSSGATTFFTADPRLSNFDASAEVDDQTIRSIPGRIGIQLSTPLTSNDEIEKENNWRLRAGLSFTHDFSDQKRTLRTTRTSTQFTTTYEEENRNRNFFSFTAALGYDFSAVNGSLSYQRDIGLDERKSADILSLQIRVPL